MAEFKDPERGFEDAPRLGRPSTITADENIEAVERIVMPHRQISIRRVAYELAIPKIIIDEIMDSQLGMKKVCTWWILKLLTPIQSANRVHCVVKNSCRRAKYIWTIISFYRNWR